jgi:hypothetical protein
MTNIFEIVDHVPTLDEALHTPEAKTSKPKPTAVEITLDEAKELLGRAVKEKGEDYVYEPLREGGRPHGRPQCAYFNPEDGCPSCMVGYVLSYKGVTYESLDATGSVVTEVQDLVEEGHLQVDNETLALLTVAQVEQDQGQTWGRALEEALATYAESAEAYESDGRDDLSEDYWF